MEADEANATAAERGTATTVEMEVVEDEFQLDFNSRLEADMDYCQRALGGEDSCEISDISRSGTATITMKLPLDEPENLAPGSDKDKHAWVRLIKVHYGSYRMGQRPKVEIFQDSEGQKPISHLNQLEKIVERYVEENWSAPNAAAYKDCCILLQIALFAWNRMSDVCYYCAPLRFSLRELQCRQAVRGQASIWIRRLELYEDSPQLEVVELLFKMFEAFAQDNTLSTLHNPRTEEFVSFGRGFKLPNGRTLRDLADCGKDIAVELFQLGYHYKLMRCIIASNPTYMVRLPGSDCLLELRTPYQYFVMLDSPDREQAFRNAKLAYGGSSFVFWYVPFRYWFDILRSGFNPGIIMPWGGRKPYVNPTLNWSYLAFCLEHTISGCEGSNTDTEGGRFLENGEYYTVALCECVGPEYEPIYAPRFILLYAAEKKGEMGEVYVDCQEPRTAAAIKDLVDKLRKSAGAT